MRPFAKLLVAGAVVAAAGLVGWQVFGPGPSDPPERPSETLVIDADGQVIAAGDDGAPAPPPEEDGAAKQDRVVDETRAAEDDRASGDIAPAPADSADGDRGARHAAAPRMGEDTPEPVSTLRDDVAATAPAASEAPVPDAAPLRPGPDAAPRLPGLPADTADNAGAADGSETAARRAIASELADGTGDAAAARAAEIDAAKPADRKDSQSSNVRAGAEEDKERSLAALAPADGIGAGKAEPEPAPDSAGDDGGAEAWEKPAPETAAPETPAVPDLPRFDMVRVEADGQTLVVGTADPNTRVEILLDGAVVGDAMSDDRGAFIAMVQAGLTDDAQSLQVRSRAPEVLAPEAAPDAAPADAETAEAAPAPGRAAALGEPDRAGPPTRLPTPAPDADDVTVAAADTAPDAAATPGGARLPEAAAAKAERPGAAAPLRADEAEPAVTRPVLSPLSAADPDDAPVRPEGGDGGNPPIAATPRDLDAPDGATGIDIPRAPDGVDSGRYRLSAPIIILPAAAAEDAPALVQPKEDELALLQPAGMDIRNVMLDRISYAEGGDLQLTGRGRPGRVVRVYGNGLIMGTVQVNPDGVWALSMPADRGREIKLFRFDEIEADGQVSSRIETPFTYSSDSPQVVRERKVVVQRGDMLWRIAEQFYGEGLRYSLIYGANTALIRDPDLIYPGQVFSIPELVDAPTSEATRSGE